MVRTALVILALCYAVPTSGQGIGPDAAIARRVDWGAGTPRKAADWLSTGAVVTAVGLPCALERTRRCLTRLSLAEGLNIGLTELVKRTLPRTRPDGSDRKSFYSGHTSMACTAALRLRNKWAGVGLCAGTAYLRMSARKHWATDVLTGAAIGFALSRGK
jgi:membrane-associated phospholipid phosphatase